MVRSTGQLLAVMCLVVLAMAFWATPSPGAVAPMSMPVGGFLDVSSDYWAYGQILACYGAGIVAGLPDGTYRPDDPVTRDQMAVYISRAIAGGDAKVIAPATASFPDVPTDYWAFKYVEYAKSKSIVSGFPDGTYGPTLAVDRAGMAVYISRAVADPTGDTGLGSYVPPATPSFPDVPTDYWAFTHIEYAKSRDIVSGFPDGTYQPLTVVTRDQMAVYVQRAFALPIPSGPPAPDFTLQTLDGAHQYRLSDLKGTPVAVFFWASWCGYSTGQAVDLETLYQRYKGQGFLVLGVGVWDEDGYLQQAVQDLGLTFPVGHNEDAGTLYGVDAVPYTFIIDRSGNIAASFYGQYPIDDVEAAVKKVL